MASLWAYVTGTWEDVYVPPNCGIVLIEHTPEGYSQPRVIEGAQGAEHAGG
jgi:hypothetical protein